jgi:hypothetical protein
MRDITLPLNLVSATILLSGASGGRGAPRTNSKATLVAVVTTPASSITSYGQISGSIPTPSGKVISINTGAPGSDGTYFVCDNTFHNGGAGGTNSYSSGNGGLGGIQGCGSPNDGDAAGTGGGGGAATVAVIDSTPIFAGGGGGTGGTTRTTYDNGNLAGGAAPMSNVSNSEVGSNGAPGQQIWTASTNIGCPSNIGAGGGGGGGYRGGNQGTAATGTCGNHNYTATTGGYPGLNGTDYGLTSLTSSYTAAATTSPVYGSAVITFIYKGQTTSTVTLTSGSLVYRTLNSITATSNIAGKVTFRANGVVVAGCKNLATKGTSPNFTATCPYKPSTHSPVTISVQILPTSSDFFGALISTAQYSVAARTGRR